MKNLIQNISLSAAKIDRRHVQTFMALLVLSLLAIGAGAPGTGGGPGGF